MAAATIEQAVLEMEQQMAIILRYDPSGSIIYQVAFRVVYGEALENRGDTIADDKPETEKVDAVAASRKKKALPSKTRKKKISLSKAQLPRKVRVNEISSSDDEVGPSPSKKGKGKEGRVYATQG